jgi:hypothetical protein
LNQVFPFCEIFGRTVFSARYSKGSFVPGPARRESNPKLLLDACASSAFYNRFSTAFQEIVWLFSMLLGLLPDGRLLERGSALPLFLECKIAFCCKAAFRSWC